MLISMNKHSQLKKSKWLDLLIFVLFINVFFFHSLGTVALVLFLTGSYLLAVRLFGKFELGTSALFGVSMLTMFLVSSPEKIVLLTLFVLGIILINVYKGMKSGPIGGILELGISSLIVIREYIRSVLVILASAVRGTLKDVLSLDYVPKERSPWVKSIIVGLLAGLPIVAWLVMTLSKADPVFSAFIKNLVSEKFLSDLPSRLALSILALLFLIPMVVMKWRGYVSPIAWLTKVRFGREMSVILAMVVVILGIFLVVQWPYVFATVAKETDLSVYGVATYSEYVKRGFWDLLKVAGMVFGVSWVTLLLSKNQNGQGKKMMLLLQGVLASEFVVFIVSIYRRVWLYQSYHGLTLARIYGLVLLTWLVGMMITMGLRYMYQNVRWVRVEVVWIVVVIFGSIVLNMESLIVKDPPTVNGRVDYVYLSRLSGDGYEGWKTAFEKTSAELSRIAQAKLPGIGVDNRREVLYGSMVLNNLILNYDKLVWKYGSEEEIKEYLKAILEWEEMMLSKYPEIATSQVTGGREEVMAAIAETKKMAEGGEWEKTGVVVRPGIQTYRGKYVFSGYDGGFYGMQRGGLEVSKRLSKFDSFLSWSFKEENLFVKMRKEISLKRLFQAIEDYWIVRLQIMTQPETERTVEVDISFGSPFLR